MDTKRFLTPNEIMDILGISYPSLLRLVKANKIPVVRIGKSLRFPKSYLEMLEQDSISELEEAGGQDE